MDFRILPQTPPLLHAYHLSFYIFQILGALTSIAIIDKHPAELINKKIECFGTPLNAILLSESVYPYKGNRYRVQRLLERGAKLHESEETPENQELLTKLRTR